MGEVKVAKRRRVRSIRLSLPHDHDNCHVETHKHSSVKKRASGQPAWRIAGMADLNRREKRLADLVEQCWAQTQPLVDTLIAESFPIGPSNTTILDDESRYNLQVTMIVESFQEAFAEILLEQYVDSGEYSMREFTKQLSKAYKRFKKSSDVRKADEVLPSEAILRFRFDRTSPTAEAYAVKSSASMVSDISDSNITGVRALVGRAFQEQRTYQQTATALTALLSETVPLNSVSQRLGQIYGINANGLFPRYANAVANFAERTALDLADRGITGSKALKVVQDRSDKYAQKLRRSRAKMISRTEIMRANNSGRLAAADQAAAKGLFDKTKAKRQWLSAPQDSCFICGPLNEVAVDYNQTWFEGEPAYVHPNCRCTWILLPNVPVNGIPTVTGTGTAANPFVWNFANQNRSLAPMQTGGTTATGAANTIPEPKPLQSTTVVDEVVPPVEVPLSEEITDIDNFVDTFLWDDAGRKWADLDVDEKKYLTDMMIDAEVEKAIAEIPTISHFAGDQGYKLMTSPPTPPAVAKEIRRLQDEAQEALINLDSQRRLRTIQIQREKAEWDGMGRNDIDQFANKPNIPQSNRTQKGTRVTKSQKFSGRTIVDEVDFPDETITGGDTVWKQLTKAEESGTAVSERQLRQRLLEREKTLPKIEDIEDLAVAKLNALGEALEREAVRRADEFVASQIGRRKTVEEVLEAKQAVSSQIDELSGSNNLGARSLEHDLRTEYVYDPKNPTKIQHVQGEVYVDVKEVGDWVNDVLPDGLDTKVTMIVDDQPVSGPIREFLTEEQIGNYPFDWESLERVGAEGIGNHLKFIDDLFSKNIISESLSAQWIDEVVPAIKQKIINRKIIDTKRSNYMITDGSGKRKIVTTVKEVGEIKKAQRDFDVFINLDEVGEAVPALDIYPPDAAVEALEGLLNDWIEYELKHPSGIDVSTGRPINAEKLTELRDRLAAVRRKDSEVVQRIVQTGDQESLAYLYRTEFKSVLDETMDMYFTSLDTPMNMVGAGRKWSAKGGALDTRRVDDILVKVHTSSLDELNKKGLMDYADELLESADEIDIDIDLIASMDGDSLLSQKPELQSLANKDLTVFTETMDFDSLVVSEMKLMGKIDELIGTIDPKRYDTPLLEADMAVFRKQIIAESRETGQKFEEVMFGRWTSDGNAIEGPMSKDAGKDVFNTKQIQANGKEMGPKAYQDMAAQQLDDAMEFMPSKWTQRLEDSFVMDGEDIYGKRARDGATRRVRGYTDTTKKHIEQDVIRRRGIVLGTDATSSKGSWERAYFRAFERDDDFTGQGMVGAQNWLNNQVMLQSSPFMVGDDVIAAGGFINIQGTGITTSTMAHELTHMMQHQNGTFLSLERAWYRYKALEGPKVDPTDPKYQKQKMNDIMGITEYNKKRRAAGQDPTVGYGSSEVAIEDQFINPYAGKTYDSAASQAGTNRVRGDIGLYGTKAEEMVDLHVDLVQSPLEATTMGTEAMFITKVDEAGNFVDTGYKENALGIWQKADPDVDRAFGKQSDVKSEDTANWIFGLFAGV